MQQQPHGLHAGLVSNTCAGHIPSVVHSLASIVCGFGRTHEETIEHSCHTLLHEAAASCCHTYTDHTPLTLCVGAGVLDTMRRRNWSCDVISFKRACLNAYYNDTGANTSAIFPRCMEDRGTHTRKRNLVS